MLAGNDGLPPASDPVGKSGELDRSVSDGSGQVPLLSGSGVHTEPTWSPDGRKIAFTLFTCDYYCYQESRSLMIMKADGTNVVELTSGSVFNPSWRW